MKKLLCIILVMMCICSYAAAEYEFTPLEIAVMKYNATASAIGTTEIVGSKVITENGVNMFTVDGCIIAILLDENGNVTNGGVQLLTGSNPGKFLLFCMTIVTFLGEMDYDAYGKLLFQYAEICAGKTASPVMIGHDMFEMKQGENGIQLVYYNYDLKCWI